MENQKEHETTMKLKLLLCLRFRAYEDLWGIQKNMESTLFLDLRFQASWRNGSLQKPLYHAQSLDPKP